MDLDLSDDQELLRDTTARFIESACPLTRVRELADAHGGPRRRLLAPGRRAGLVRDARPRGVRRGHGVGQRCRRRRRSSPRSAVAFLQPGAFVATNAVACALAADGSDEQRAKVLPSIASGDATATWALASSDGDWSPGTGLHASSAGWRLRAHRRRSGFVQDADLADWILVTASERWRPLAVPRTRRHCRASSFAALEGLDLTRRFCEVPVRRRRGAGVRARRA